MNEFLKEYQSNGYYLFESFFDKATINAIKEDAKYIFIQQMKAIGILASSDISEEEFESAMSVYFQQDSKGFINCGKTCQHLISLHRLSLEDKLIDMLIRFGVQKPNICT